MRWMIVSLGVSVMWGLGCHAPAEKPAAVPVYQAPNRANVPKARTAEAEASSESRTAAEATAVGERGSRRGVADGRRISGRAADFSAEAISFSAPAGRLRHWTFDNENYYEPEGGAWLGQTNALLVPSFDGRALLMRGPGAARAVYAATNSSGVPWLGKGHGGIRFWYKPFWFSNGRGPEHWLRLVEWGGLKISIPPGGRELIVETRGADGMPLTNVVATAPFPSLILPVDPNFYWHEIIWNYMEERSWVVVDGRFQRNPTAPNTWGKPWNGMGDDRAPISIGSDPAGQFPAEGMIDELETFDHPISPLESQWYWGADYLAARVVDGGAGVELRWRNVAATTNGCVDISRRPLGEGPWELLTNSCRSSVFLDRTVQAGERYEYRVGDKYLLAGVRSRPVEQRGKVLVVMDQTVAGNLGDSWQQLRKDLIGDGWAVVRHDVPRHNDATWSKNTNGIVELKQWIAGEFAGEDPALEKAVLLVGHVPVPYSGLDSEDGHAMPLWDAANHNGAWPADSYYGDLLGSWTDSKVRFPDPYSPVLENVPGDGKFDPTVFETNFLQVGVGRLDFSRLSDSFKGASEVELLRRYFDKDHRYRHGRLSFADRVLALGKYVEPFDWLANKTFSDAIRLASRNGQPMLEGDLFADKTGALWGLEAGFGGYHFLHYDPRQIMSSVFAAETTEPSCGFYIFSGSYFGDWNRPENFLRAALGGTHSGLGSMWGFRIDWHFEKMALGGTIGSGVAQTSREPSRVGASKSVRTIALLGDPTLRWPLPTPPEGLTAQREGNGVRLRWTEAAAPVLGYYAYRSEGGWDGPLRRISGGEPTAANFLDANPPAGKKIYGVRSVALTVTGSGSYTNLSEAAFVTVE